MDRDRFRHYVGTQRRVRGLQRATDYVFLGIVLVVLGGAVAGLVPELEESRRLDQSIAEERERVEVATSMLREKQLRLQHLQNDVDYMEQELRNSSRRSAKPGEILILLPPGRSEIYEAEDPR